MTMKKRTSRQSESDAALARRFGRTINMSAAQIRRWHADPRSKLASFAHIRAELPLLARMKETAPSRWTPTMWNKARRALAFVERHEAQMQAQGMRYGTGRLHVTPKRIIALMNWGRVTPGVSLARQLRDDRR
jgi:hypothetical protein